MSKPFILVLAEDLLDETRNGLKAAIRRVGSVEPRGQSNGINESTPVRFPVLHRMGSQRIDVLVLYPSGTSDCTALANGIAEEIRKLFLPSRSVAVKVVPESPGIVSEVLLG